MSFMDLASFLSCDLAMKGKSGHLQRKLQSCLWPQSGKKPRRPDCTQEYFCLSEEEAQGSILLNK